MSVITESRSEKVIEPDAKLRITAEYYPEVRYRQAGVVALGVLPSVVVCTVEVRRGVGEVLSLTITGDELLRLVHDSVYLADDRYRLGHASGPDDPGNG